MKKCPKCELNYIRGDAPYCDVCMRALRHESGPKKTPVAEEELMCSECGEAPAVHGFELCAECLKEQKRQKELENAIDPDAAEEFDVEAIEAEEDDE